MYQFQSRISYSEVGENGTLNIPDVINYFQDASLFHSHDVGMDLDTLRNLHRAWLLSSWHIIFNRLPAMGEKVTIKTWPYEFKSIYGLRNYILESENGDVLAYGEAHWFMFDSAIQKPIRPEAIDTDCYEVEERLDMEYLSRRIKHPQDLTFVESVKIYPNQLDTNHHVNNGEYVRISCDYLPLGFESSELRVEYRNAAHVGDTVYVYTTETEEALYVLLTNQDQTPYTISEFKKK